MSAESTYREWAKMNETDREAFLDALLRRPEVRSWVENYQGDHGPQAVVRMTESAGLGLDDIDVGLLALALDEREVVSGSPDAATLWRVVRSDPSRYCGVGG